MTKKIPHVYPISYLTPDKKPAQKISAAGFLCQLKILHHLIGCLFIQLRHLGVNDTINALTQVQHTGAMRGHDTGLVRMPMHDIAQHLPFGCDIQCAGCLIQQQNRRVTQHRTRNADALRLSL